LIAELAVHNHLPSVYGAREFVDAGGLMSDSTDYPQLYYDSARLSLRLADLMQGPSKAPTKHDRTGLLALT
jgi:hypothetical protein